MSHLRRHTCAVFVHPQLIWRVPLFNLVEQFEQRGLRLWNRRTHSGRNVLTLEPATIATRSTPMGIDIYATFDGMTETEKAAQYTGFDVHQGAVGYLREAYHGDPYATRELVPEAFAADNGEAQIPAAVLRERLPLVLATARLRALKVYKEPDERAVQAFADFVAYCESAEAKTGKPCTIIASY